MEVAPSDPRQFQASCLFGLPEKGVRRRLYLESDSARPTRYACPIYREFACESCIALSDVAVSLILGPYIFREELITVLKRKYHLAPNLSKTRHV